MDRGAWWGYSPRGRKESDMTVQTYVLQGSIGDPGKPGGVHTARDCFLVVSWPRALGACRFTTRGSLGQGSRGGILSLGEASAFPRSLLRASFAVTAPTNLRPLPHGHEGPHSQLQRLGVPGHLSRACYTPSCVSRRFLRGPWAWSVETREAEALTPLRCLQSVFRRLPKSCSKSPHSASHSPQDKAGLFLPLFEGGRVRRGVGESSDRSRISAIGSNWTWVALGVASLDLLHQLWLPSLSPGTSLPQPLLDY